MRSGLHTAALVAALLALSVGASTASALSGPGANENSKLVYDEAIVGTDLVLTFDEGALRRFEAVDYRLDATVDVIRFCNGQGLGVRAFPSASLTGLMPDERGRVGATLTLDGPGDTFCGCCTGGTLEVDYFDITLTNLLTGHQYRLEPLSRTYSI